MVKLARSTHELDRLRSWTLVAALLYVENCRNIALFLKHEEATILRVVLSLALALCCFIMVVLMLKARCVFPLVRPLGFVRLGSLALLFLCSPLIPLLETVDQFKPFLSERLWSDCNPSSLVPSALSFQGHFCGLDRLLGFLAGQRNLDFPSECIVAEEIPLEM